MDSQFEEKQYEQLINCELARNYPFYPVGQVFENQIGIDAALFSKKGTFWNSLINPTFPKKPPGIPLDSKDWKLLKHNLKTDKFPKFKCNIFIQYKRPVYIFGHNGKEYSHWKQPYFRYDINSHQQNILSKLERIMSPNAIVVYACPAFWRIDDLFDYSISHQLISNSNFAQPYKLKKHQKYTFIKAGSDGKAFSEPVDVKNINIKKLIDSTLEMQNNFENNVDFIYSLDKSIMQVLNQFKDYKMAFNSLLKTIEIPEHKLAKNIIDILIFTFITNTNWSIIYGR